MKNFKPIYFLYILLVILVIAFIIYWVLKPSTTVPPVNPNTNPNQNPNTNNIGNILSGLINSSWLSNLFGGGNNCDPNNPGFQKNGTYNPDKCGAAIGFQCDPNKPGFNMQGFPDINCGFGG